MNLFQPSINRYKKYRKYKQLSCKYNKQYAFVGIGNHSINNLYPILDYLHVDIKYIVTNTKKSVEAINNSGWGNAVSDFNIATNDPDVAGIFISASPKNHYNLLCKAIKSNKHIFVEKPPCFTLEELQNLIKLQKEQGKEVLVGLQKRYAPAYSALKKQMKNVQHYTMRYCTGAYPEGDALFDLFIHPIDIVCYLFGIAEIKSSVTINGTRLLHLTHKSGISGSLELSTDYSWQTPIESLIVVAQSGIFELNSSELVFKTKPTVIANIPLEKIMGFTPKTKLLFSQNSFLPIMEHNNLYVNGFYSEIENFVNICEGKSYKNHSKLESLLATYKILDALNK